MTTENENKFPGGIWWRMRENERERDGSAQRLCLPDLLGVLACHTLNQMNAK